MSEKYPCSPSTELQGCTPGDPAKYLPSIGGSYNPLDQLNGVRLKAFYPGHSYYFDLGEHQIYVGKVIDEAEGFISLEKMSWVKSRGDYEQFMKHRSFDHKLYDKGTPTSDLPVFKYIGKGAIPKGTIKFFTSWLESNLPKGKK